MSDIGTDAARIVRFAQHHHDGVLTVFPGDSPDGVPFRIARVFTISGVPAGATRGHHAHRACAQLVTCLSGGVDVALDDGRNLRTIALDTAATGVLIPPGIWNVITFASPATVVAVFCDHPYDERDYIRDRDEYLRMRGIG